MYRAGNTPHRTGFRDGQRPGNRRQAESSRDCCLARCCPIGYPSAAEECASAFQTGRVTETTRTVAGAVHRLVAADRSIGSRCRRSGESSARASAPFCSSVLIAIPELGSGDRCPFGATCRRPGSRTRPTAPKVRTGSMAEFAGSSDPDHSRPSLVRPWSASSGGSDCGGNPLELLPGNIRLSPDSPEEFHIEHPLTQATCRIPANTTTGILAESDPLIWERCRKFIAFIPHAIRQVTTIGG